LKKRGDGFMSKTAKEKPKKISYQATVGCKSLDCYGCCEEKKEEATNALP